MKRNISAAADASLLSGARFFHWVASLLSLSVGHGWFFSPPRRP